MFVDTKQNGEAFVEPVKQPQYKSAAELKLPRELRDALVTLLDRLEAGKKLALRFDMGTWQTCLYGQARLVSKAEIPQLPHGYIADNKLFYRCTGSLPQATRALRNFLVTGDPKWREARHG